MTCADTSNVDTVIVGGRIVKHNGQLMRLDMPRLFDRLSNARDYLLSHAGVIPKWFCRAATEAAARRRARTASSALRRLV